MESSNKTMFRTKHFHFCPIVNDIKGLGWRGFLPTYQLEIDSEKAVLSRNGKNLDTYELNHIEACMMKTPYMGLSRNKKIRFAKLNKKTDSTQNSYYFDMRAFYVNKDKINEFINVLKSMDAKCCSTKSIVLSSGNVYMGPDYVIEYGKDEIDHKGISTKDIKFYFTKKSSILPWSKKRELITGANEHIKIEGVESADIKKFEKYIVENGAKFGGDNNKSYQDRFTLSQLIHPSLWFTKSNIGLGEEGVSFSQKTFKTNDNVYLPYSKINYISADKKWYNLFTRKVKIYGEQNITPKRPYSSSDVKEIVETLNKRGIIKFSGETFKSSYHGNLLGALFTSKRNTLTIDSKKIGWIGSIYILNDDEEKKKTSKDKAFAGGINDICYAVYKKKHWWNLRGNFFMLVRPHNIRELSGDAHQDSFYYDFELYKIWSGTASDIKERLTNGGYVEDEECQWFKKWCKKNMFK
jgi:hypothetical protein